MAYAEVDCDLPQSASPNVGSDQRLLFLREPTRPRSKRRDPARSSPQAARWRHLPEDGEGGKNALTKAIPVASASKS
jgi:hypothetical protein